MANLDPVAMAMIKKIEADKGKKIKTIKPGQKPPLGSMLVFRYIAKHKQKLDVWDAMPASIVLGHYSDGFLAINTHYLPYLKRLNLAERLLRATKNKNRITYRKLKKALKGLQLPLAYANFMLKRYLNNHITSAKIYVFTFEDYKEFLVNIPPKFQKRTDKFAFAAVTQAFRAHVKASKGKKVRNTNVKRKK